MFAWVQSDSKECLNLPGKDGWLELRLRGCVGVDYIDKGALEKVFQAKRREHKIERHEKL